MFTYPNCDHATMIPKQVNEETNTKKNRYQPIFPGASSSVILSWMKNDFEESLEEIVDLFIKSLKGYLEI